MIQINKNMSNEPASWTAYKNTPGVSYAPSADLRNALLKEQGHICAFCMRRIPLTKKDPKENETSKIAHLETRTNKPGKALDYDNMVICCPGNIDGNAHCDKSQGPIDVTLPFFQPQLQASISYGSYTGEVKSSEAGWNTQIQDVLKLNNNLLKLNRLETLNAIRSIMEGNKWRRAKIQEKLEEWTSFDQEGKLKPYCGIVIWYLQKKLKVKVKVKV